MVVIMRQDKPQHIVYEVDYIHNYNDFLDWLYKLDADDFSLSIGGNIYHFRTREEKIQFVFGFQMAWRLGNSRKLPFDDQETT